MKQPKQQLDSKIRIKLGEMYYNVNNMLRYGTADMFHKFCIEISTKCNRHCSYCPNSKYSRGNFRMDWDLFKKIIENLKSINYNQWIIPSFYNEPLLMKDLREWLSYIKQELPKAKIWIFTNGDYLNEDRFKELDAYVDRWLVTNHGNLNKDIPDSPKITVENLSYYSTRGGLVDVPNLVLMERCTIPSYTFQVLYNGDCVICCDDYFGKYIFGNIGEELLMDIWNKPLYKEARKKLRNGIAPFEICTHCLKKEWEHPKGNFG